MPNNKNESQPQANPFAFSAASSSPAQVFCTQASTQDGIKTSVPVFPSAVPPVFSTTSASLMTSTSSVIIPTMPTPVFSPSLVSPLTSTAASSMFPAATTAAVFSSNITSLPFSGTASPVFSSTITSPPLSTIASSVFSSSVISPLQSSNKLTVFSTQQPASATSSASVFPPSLFQPQNNPVTFSGSFGDPGKVKGSTGITFTPKTGTAAGLSVTETSATTGLKGLPSSSLASAKPMPTTNVNIFGGGNIQSSSPVTSVFGGAIKKSKDDLQAGKADDAKNSKACEEQHSAECDTGVVSGATFTPNLLKRSSGNESSSNQGKPTNIFGGSFGGSGVLSSAGALETSAKVKSPSRSKSDTVKDSNIYPPAPLAASPKASHTGDNTSADNVSSSVSSIFGGSKEGQTGVSSKSKSRSKSLFTTAGAGAKTPQIKLDIPAACSISSNEPESPDISFIGKSDPVSPSGSSPEISKKELTKIIVAMIPDCCMEKEILRTHFAKYGDVKRVILNTKVNQATVQYSTHAEASRAKKKGRKIHPKLPEVKIFYGTPARRRSEEGSNEAMLSKKKAIKTLQHVHQPPTPDIDPYTPLKRPCEQDIVMPQPLATARYRITSKHTDTPEKTKPTVSKKKESRVKSKSAENESSSVSQKYDLNSQGIDSNARFLILKERDRLLRKKFQRTSDLNKAAYLSATCPDMCPELERYMRDVQYDLSPFEMTDGILDHRLVTKKFSRSSADKEEPLPHELRPGPVLLRTMDFLICNVISRVDEEGMLLDVWYNYLWNRTRAVRNDLMQQQLTDDIAVVIMERCTRFHIYAAARLCGEPADLFDAKMNTEHLTKSLQTLKELYYDLSEKDKYFDTEPEFRAYEMLLNLNDGETIVHQYSKFREEVQKSAQVQFALKVILAVMFNNYIKFFKLIQQATYLQGCLLLRYFRQVRSKALDTMMRAYTFTGKQSIPLHTIINMLGFEDDDDAVSYLTTHGVSVEEDSVILDKQSFIAHPEEWPSVVRPVRLVEVKRNCSVSEVIQGGPLPDNPVLTHTPHNSFNDQGYLKPESKDASDQQKQHITQSPLGSAIASVTKPETQQNYQLLARMKDIYNMIESSALSEMLTQICSDVFKVLRHDMVLKETANAITQEILEDGVTRELKNLSQEGYLEVEKEEKERLRRQREREEKERRIIEEMHERMSVSIHADYSDQFIQEQIVQICQEAMKEIKTEVALKELLEEIPQRCINEVLSEEFRQISQEALDAVTEEQEQRIKEFQRNINLRMMGEIFKAWRKLAQRSQRRKQSQETFPAMCSQLTLRQQNQALGWGYHRQPVEDMTIIKLNKLECDLSACLEKVVLTKQLMRECAWMPLPLQTRLEEEVNKLPPVSLNIISQYFKVLLCVNSSASPGIRHWLRTKMGFEDPENLEEPSTHCFRVVSRKTGIEYAWVITEALLNSISAEDLEGTSLVVFVSSDMGTQDSQYHKLTQIIARMPRVSCIKIFFESKNTTQDGWSLMEEDLLKPEVSERLQNVVFRSWHQHGNILTVTAAHLNSVVSGLVAKKFVEPVLVKHNERTADGKSPMYPSVLIDLFNSVITFLIMVVDDDDVKNLDWPPSELNHMSQVPPPTWNKADIMNITRLLSHVMLPKLSVGGFSTWQGINKAIHSYGLKVVGSEGDATGLISHLNTILLNTRQILEPVFGIEDEDFAECKLHVLQLPWTELIYACVSHQLSELPDATVFYQPKRMESFVYPESWWNACDTSDPEWACAVMDVSMNGSRKRKIDTLDQPWNNQSKVQKLPTKLLTDIEDEKQKCAELSMKTETSILEIEEELKYLFGESF